MIKLKFCKFLALLILLFTRHLNTQTFGYWIIDTNEQGLKIRLPEAIDTTANKSKPIIDRLTMSFQ